MSQYDMNLYRSKRAEIAQYSDQQIIFRALAHLLGGSFQSGYSFEYTRALIDDLVRRAEQTTIQVPSTDVITLLRASTEWGPLGAAMADVLELINATK